MNISNIISFDLEDWFHILDLGKYQPSFSDWETLPSNLHSNIESILQLLSEKNVTATFFTLGWIAEKYPSIVKLIDSNGHEIASHGYRHDLICSLSPYQFRNDLRRSKQILEDIIGKSVLGYRGPGFSITSRNLWAFDIIAEEGYRYDTTVYPGTHGHGGIPQLPSKPFTLTTLKGYKIVEFPVTVLRFGRIKMTFFGGGYFRLFPFALINHLLSSCNKKNLPVMVYIHPRDLDRNTHRLSMPFIRRFKCYINISRAYHKLYRLLSYQQFTSIRNWQLLHNSPLPNYSLNSLFPNLL